MLKWELTQLLKILDLCSGLGGFSEAWLLAGYEVTRIENNPDLSHVPNTTIICIHEFAKKITRGQFDVILASPPCVEFSLAYNSPRSVAYRQGEIHKPDMSILLSVMTIVNIVKPKWYIIENVVGSQRYFEPYVGKPGHIHKPFLFYGVFPKLPNLCKHKKPDDRRNPLRSNVRAKIPLSISKAIMNSMVGQQTLF